MFRKYRFVIKDLPVITYEQLIHLLNISKANSLQAHFSLDLGITFSEINLRKRMFFINDYYYSIDSLLLHVKKGYVYVLDKGEVYPIAYYRDGFYYKLYPVSSFSAPTIEISGVKMHRVVGITPWKDSETKVSLLGIKPSERILDVCTGLGYTGIHAYMHGGNVVTIENDPNVLDIASYNPWSRELVNIDIILGNAYDVIHSFDDMMFQAVIHDPPRFSRAGQLYSLSFYKELYRVLSDDGRLFHYCGKVGYKKRGLDIIKGVAVRLRKTGFKVKLMRDRMGVYAYK